MNEPQGQRASQHAQDALLLNSDKVYSLTTAVLLAAVTILAAVRWHQYPVFVDSYYHMSVIQGFEQAGGIVTHALCEMAPGGRVHIYPPGLHAIGYLVTLLSIEPRSFITFISWVCYPACLLATWLWLRRVSGARAALFALVLLCSPTAFLFNQAAHTANAVVMVLVPLALWAQATETFWLCGVLNFLTVATHPMGLMLPPALAFNTLLSMRRVFAGLLAAVLPVVLFSPWLLHMWLSRSVLSERFRTGSFSLGQHGIVIGWLPVLCALLGIVWSLLRRDRTLSLLGAAAGFAVVLPLGLAGRFLTFVVHWPLACLGGLGVAELAERSQRRAKLRPAVAVGSLCVGYLALSVFPALVYLPGRPPQAAAPFAPRRRWHLSVLPAVLPTLLNPAATISPGLGGGPGLMDLIHRSGAHSFLEAVKENVAIGELIFVSDPPTAALITGVTGRWTTDGMLPGVQRAGRRYAQRI